MAFFFGCPLVSLNTVGCRPTVLFWCPFRMKGMVDPISISCTFHGGKKTIGSQVQKVGASLTLVVQISSFILRWENLRGCRLRGWGVSGSFKKRRPEKCPIKIQVWSFLEVSGYMFIGKESDGDSMVSWCSQPTIIALISCQTSLLARNLSIFRPWGMLWTLGPITCGWVKKSPRTKQKGGQSLGWSMDSGFPYYYQLGKPFGRRLDFQGMSKKVRSFFKCSICDVAGLFRRQAANTWRSVKLWHGTASWWRLSTLMVQKSGELASWGW